MDFLPFTRPSIDEETISKVGDVLRSGWITTGPNAKAFEAELSEYFGNRPVRVVSSATAALKMALQVAKIGAGDEVITTPMSWIATANVILDVGAKVVFVDADKTTRNIDIDLIEKAITSKTKAIIIVDLAGLPVNRSKLYSIANKYNLRVIEDAAQSIGAKDDKGELIGTSGDLISFSFHANKNITTTEGGCLVMGDAETSHFEKLRLQGVTRFTDGTMDVDLIGGKCNLTDLAAVIGREQLKKVDQFNMRRRELAEHYFKCFDRNLGFDLPMESSATNLDNDKTESNWHMFQPLLPLDNINITRSEFIDAMKQKNIGVGVHYPAMHLFSLFQNPALLNGSKIPKLGDFPIAEYIGERTITLPLFPEMRFSDVERVCEAISNIIKVSQK